MFCRPLDDTPCRTKTEFGVDHVLDVFVDRRRRRARPPRGVGTDDARDQSWQRKQRRLSLARRVHYAIECDVVFQDLQQLSRDGSQHPIVTHDGTMTTRVARVFTLTIAGPIKGRARVRTTIGLRHVISSA